MPRHSTLNGSLSMTRAVDGARRHSDQQIVLRQFAAGFNRQIGRLQDARRPASPDPERLLAAGADLRVTGKDLLDQRRTGARQADDQQRRLVIQPKASVSGEKIPSEATHQPIDVGCKGISVEGRVSPLEAMCGIELPHRSLVVAELVQDFADGEVQRDAVIVSEAPRLRAVPASLPNGDDRLRYAS